MIAASEAKHGDLAGRTVVITGATSGIGKATALAIARQGAKLVLVGRDAQRGDDAVRQIVAQTGNKDVDLLIGNLASQRSVRRVAEQINARYDRIHVLINNAGSVVSPRRVTEDGVEETFAVNHLGPFLLTALLLDKLQAGAPARVVNLTSGLHSFARIDFADLQGARRYKPFRAYNQSKLANLLFTYELARRLQGTGVTTNAVHPGVVRTNLGRRDSVMPWYASLLFRLIWGHFLIEPEEAALHVVRAATAADLASAYLVNGRPARSSKESYDEQIAKRLWDVSETLTRRQQVKEAI